MSSTTRAEPGRGSLAVRLTLWYSAFSFGLILAATAYLYWALAKNLDREDDGVLQDQIHILQVLLREHPDDSEGIRQEVELESGARQHSRIYIRILDGGGRMIAETPGMGQKLPREVFPSATTLESGSQIHQAKESFRLMTAPAVLGKGPEVRVLQVALDRREEDKLLSQFRRRILPLLAVALGVSALAGYQIARRGLRPIKAISDAAGRIRSTTLHERLPAGAFPAELAGLARTFNDMLDRLQEAFDRLSRFSAEIAHELRTPISTLRGEVEVALGRPRTPEEYRETLSSFLEEAGRLTRLIESLLFLARAEHPETQVRREPLDLDRELRGVREFYEAAAGEAGVTLDVRVTPPLAAVDDDRVADDLGVDHRALADRQGVLGMDLALHRALDPRRPLEGELADDPASLAQETARPAALVVRDPHLLALVHFPLRTRTRSGRGDALECARARSITPLSILSENRHRGTPKAPSKTAQT